MAANNPDMMDIDDNSPKWPRKMHGTYSMAETDLLDILSDHTQPEERRQGVRNELLRRQEVAKQQEAAKAQEAKQNEGASKNEEASKNEGRAITRRRAALRGPADGGRVASPAWPHAGLCRPFRHSLHSRPRGAVASEACRCERLRSLRGLEVKQ